MSNAKISIVLQAHDNLPYANEEFQKTFDSLNSQYFKDFEVILYGTGDFARTTAANNGYIFVEAGTESNSVNLNAALKQATGDHVLICDNATCVIEFKKSAFTFYNMLANRHAGAVLFYTDYDILDKGVAKERKLLEFHKGRILETWDLGYCLLFKRAFLEKINFADEKYRYNPLYDIRLKAFMDGNIVHVSNRFNGVPYLIHAAARAHDVFAYLKAGKEVSLELEAIATQHLQRIGAYLKPDQNYRKVEYTPEEAASFEVIATVVIPVFNRPEFIGPAIESVQAQTVQNIEIAVVCNGGADDPTIAAVRQYMEGGTKYDPAKPKVRLLIHDMNNIGLCFNSALQTSKAKYYMQLDSDDLLVNNAIEKILKVFDQNDEIGIVIGSYQVFEKKADGTIAPVLVNGENFIVTHDEWTDANGRNNLLRVGGAGAPRCIKIKVLEQMGWFGMNDIPYCRNYGEDYDIVNKIAEKYRVGRVWDPIYKVVRHPGGTDHMIDQVTIDINDNAKDDMRLKAIQRRQRLNKADTTNVRLNLKVEVVES